MYFFSLFFVCLSSFLSFRSLDFFVLVILWPPFLLSDFCCLFLSSGISAPLAVVTLILPTSSSSSSPSFSSSFSSSSLALPSLVLLSLTSSFNRSVLSTDENLNPSATQRFSRSSLKVARNEKKCYQITFYIREWKLSSRSPEPSLTHSMMNKYFRWKELKGYLGQSFSTYKI